VHSFFSRRLCHQRLVDAKKDVAGGHRRSKFVLLIRDCSLDVERARRILCLVTCLTTAKQLFRFDLATSFLDHNRLGKSVEVATHFCVFLGVGLEQRNQPAVKQSLVVLRNATVIELLLSIFTLFNMRTFVSVAFRRPPRVHTLTELVRLLFVFRGQPLVYG